MRVKLLNVLGTWRNVADSARTTIGEEAGIKEPKSHWKRRMLLAEHSPIRRIHISWKWYDLMYWVSVHFVRHKFGIEHYVKTQRTDRTGDDRNTIPQGALVNHECEANLQAIINISRKRLCKLASSETREAWLIFLTEMSKQESELRSVCVPDCVYRGWCYEFKSCGYHLTPAFRNHIDTYRRNINIWEEFKNGNLHQN